MFWMCGKPTCEDSASDAGIRDLGPDPEHGVDVLAQVEVGPAHQHLTAVGVSRLGRVLHHLKVPLGVRHHERQRRVVHQVLAAVYL